MSKLSQTSINCQTANLHEDQSSCNEFSCGSSGEAPTFHKSNEGSISGCSTNGEELDWAYEYLSEEKKKCNQIENDNFEWSTSLALLTIQLNLVFLVPTILIGQTTSLISYSDWFVL